MANEINIDLGKRRSLKANIGVPGYLGKGDPGTGIERIDFIGNDKDGGNVYRVYLTDGTYYDITAPKGAPGSGGSGGGSNEVWLPAMSDGVLTWTKSDSDIPPAPANIKGADGADGADGVTPHIGDNGNWYLGTTDTGKPSRGEPGLQGPVGPVGPQGPRGEKGEDAAADRTLGLTGATVGQIAKITAVDASGVPTAWSPVDMPSCGGSNWVKVYDGSNTITEEISVFEVDLTKSDPMKEFQLLLKLDKNTAADWRENKNINVTVNGETIGYFMFYHRLNTAVEFYEERNLEAMKAAKRCISSVSLTANVVNSMWMVEQGVKQQNNGKLSIAFPAPYAGKITAKVFGRY